MLLHRFNIYGKCYGLFCFCAIPLHYEIVFWYCYVNCMRITNLNLCHLLQHDKICMWAFSYLVCWTWKVHKGFYFDYFVFLNFLLSLYVCLFIGEKDWKKVVSIFLIFFFFITFFVFLLNLKSLKVIVPNFLEIFMVIDFLHYNKRCPCTWNDFNRFWLNSLVVVNRG